MNMIYEVMQAKTMSDPHAFIVEDKDLRLILLFNKLKMANKHYIIDLVRSLTFHDRGNTGIARKWSALAMNAENTTLIARQRIKNIEDFYCNGNASCKDNVHMSSSFKVNVLVGISTVFSFSGCQPLPRCLTRAAAKKLMLMILH